MRFKLRQPDARRRYARRKAIVEPVFGQLKDARGFTTLSLRGLQCVLPGEYLLACLAHNLGKLQGLPASGPLCPHQQRADRRSLLLLPRPADPPSSARTSSPALPLQAHTFRTHTPVTTHAS